MVLLGRCTRAPPLHLGEMEKRGEQDPVEENGAGVRRWGGGTKGYEGLLEAASKSADWDKAEAR